MKSKDAESSYRAKNYTNCSSLSIADPGLDHITWRRRRSYVFALEKPVTGARATRAEKWDDRSGLIRREMM